MEAIFKFHFDCGRDGELIGIFTADTEQVENLISSGDEVYFGEVLGKHSEICGLVEENDISFITSDEEAVKMFKENNLETGFNPFDYYNQD